jgi:transcriptional regulator with XRE-family HTH domain
MKDKSDFGDLLADLAKKRHKIKNQTKLADKLGKTQPEISAYETGAKQPPLDFIDLCVEKLELSCADKNRLLCAALSKMKEVTFKMEDIKGISKEAFNTLFAAALSFERPNPCAHNMGYDQQILNLEEYIMNIEESISKEK